MNNIDNTKNNNNDCSNNNKAVIITIVIIKIIVIIVMIVIIVIIIIIMIIIIMMIIIIINSQALSLVRYSAWILKLTKDELKVMDRKTRIIMTMKRLYHPHSDTDRLYIPRMEGGEGLLSTADCAEIEGRNLSLYQDQSEERLLRLSKSERIFPKYEVSVSTAKKQKKEERREQWKKKHLRGKFLRETEENKSEETWGWVRKGYLKKESECLIFAAQEQAPRTSWIRKNIDG